MLPSMDLIAATSSTMMPSTWRRSVRRRAPPVSEREEDEWELGRRVAELEAAVEELREEKDAAEAEEAALRAELDAERGAAGSAASETMLMIERLQREKAVALVEARQYGRLAEGRAERDRVLQDELASLSALAGHYLSLLHAHGIDPDGGDDQEGEERPVKRTDPDADGESSMDAKGAVVEKGSPSPPEKESEYTVETGRAVSAATEAVASTTGNLHARVEALEADRAATRGEAAALRAEPAKVVLAREVARRLCLAAAETRSGAVATPRFSVLPICKWLLSMFPRRKNCSTTARFTSGSAAVVAVAALLGMVLLLDRSSTALGRRRQPPRSAPLP